MKDNIKIEEKDYQTLKQENQYQFITISDKYTKQQKQEYQARKWRCIQEEKNYQSQILNIFDKPREQEENNLNQQCGIETTQKRRLSLRSIKKKNQNAKKARRKRCPMTERALVKVIQLFQNYEKSLTIQKDPAKQMNLTSISNILGYSYSTVKNLFKDYLYDRTLMHRFVCIRRRKDKHVTSDIILKRMEAIKAILAENPFRTQNQVAIMLSARQQLKKDGKDVQPRTISRLLRMMKYSKKKVLKVPKFRNVPKNIDRRYEYCVYYKSLIDQKKKIYFLDESGFNLFTFRDMAWSKVNQPVHHKVQFPNGKNVSLIAIISQNGVIDYDVKNGNFRKQHHISFLQKFISRKAASKNQERQYIIMDNCKIHDRSTINALAQKAGNIQILYLPPYSPMLNPIENWFHQLKAKIKKAVFDTQQEFITAIKRTITQYHEYDFSKYYRNTLEHIEKGIKRQQF